MSNNPASAPHFCVVIFTDEAAESWRDPLFLTNVNNRLRVLFVCTLNQWRSPTAEMLYRSDPRLSVRSAGVSSSAKHLISASDVNWADVIFVMERGHKTRIVERFRGSPLPPISVLDMPENLPFMNPELQRLLREALDPEINALLAARDSSEDED